MRLKHSVVGVAFATLLLASSCSTPKNITYFQDVQAGAVINPLEQMEIRVRPEDKLSILVNTQDPTLSMQFNLVQSMTRLQPTTTSTGVGTNITSSTDGRMSYYTVNQAGDIDFPLLGTLHIGGMTRFEVAEYIRKELVSRELVKDPIVTVEFANTGISVLGEVAAPGRYEFNKDRVTILDAISMARDLTTTGERENVMVLRQGPDGSQQVYSVDLTNLSSLASSPVFYMQQNDVIYVEPNDKKKRETTASGNTPYTPSFWITVGSLGVTIATLITTLTR